MPIEDHPASCGLTVWIAKAKKKTHKVLGIEVRGRREEGNRVVVLMCVVTDSSLQRPVDFLHTAMFSGPAMEGQRRVAISKTKKMSHQDILVRQRALRNEHKYTS